MVTSAILYSRNRRHLLRVSNTDGFSSTDRRYTFTGPNSRVAARESDIGHCEVRVARPCKWRPSCATMTGLGDQHGSILAQSNAAAQPANNGSSRSMFQTLI